MPTYNFEKVSLPGTRTIVVGGKKKRQSKTFWQTLNPFNLAPDGMPKTRSEIMAELVTERKKWMEEGS